MDQLKKDHGTITGYKKPLLKMKGSILSLSSTSGGGRGADDGDIIGGVINHGKRKYWKRGDDFQYHCTLEKGESTLEAMLCRLLMRSLTKTNLQFKKQEYLEEFDKFMTTPGTHNDTYG